MPKQGWLNDPNGPLYYKGKFHMFFQHLVQGCEWGFGLVWGHAVSSDLIHWERLPEALYPTPGGVDADGCFSGCATINVDGQPVILFTGVRLRSNPDCGPLPPPDRDLHLPFIESQCFAVADPACENLSRWHKADMPFLSLPPPDLPLAGWRDPFIIQRGDGVDTPWIMLLGSGLKGRGGTALVYHSYDLFQGWQYAGMLCCGEGDTGLVWECPILWKLQPLPLPSRHSHTLGLSSHLQRAPSLHTLDSAAHHKHDRKANGTADTSTFMEPSDGKAVCSPGTYPVDETRGWFFCISPDAPTNPVLYWLGEYRLGEFDIANASGPERLDLGDVLYAPNVLEDDKGRFLLWGWLQERRKVGSYDYAGCLTVPRVLHLRGDHLHQSPAPEVDLLRSGESWFATNIKLYDGERTPLTNVAGHHLDLDVCFNQGDAQTTGLVIKCFDAAVGEGDAMLLYHWERQHLEVVVEGLHPDTLQYSADAPTARRMGGTLDMKPGDTLQLRVLLDHSCVEVFAASGEVLSTRVYRGNVPVGVEAGVDFVSLGGSSVLTRVAAYEMGSIWKQQLAEDMSPPFTDDSLQDTEEWCDLTCQSSGPVML